MLSRSLANETRITTAKYQHLLHRHRAACIICEFHNLFSFLTLEILTYEPLLRVITNLLSV